MESEVLEPSPEVTPAPRGEVKSELNPDPVEGTKGVFSLEDRLARATERKAPPVSTARLDKDTSEAKSLFWGDDDIESDITGTQEEKPTLTGKAEKPTDKAFRTSARTATLMVDNVQKTIFTPLINWKYSKKFTKEEYDKLDEISELPKEKVKEEDLTLYNRFNRLLKKRDKKLADIPLTSTEQSDMEEAFYQYCKVTEKTLSPGWLIGLNLTNVMAKRSIDLFTE